MINVAIHGGLGNQLFEVAAGLYLKQRGLGIVRIDGRFLKADGDRRELVALDLLSGLAHAGRFLHILSRTIRWIADRWPTHSWAHRNPLWNYVKDPQDGTLGLLERLTRSPLILLDGYWQWGGYSDDFIGLLRKRLERKLVLGERARALVVAAQSMKTVAVHVRRGDYVQDESMKSFHGVCSSDYYRRAASYVSSLVSIDQFFVFSDEINWAKSNLRFDRPSVFINDDGRLSDIEEFAIMCRCRYFITANSTFSWWAARLASAPDKVVVTPRRWFTKPRASEAGLFPPDWYRIS
jgi:hypothetical protein